MGFFADLLKNAGGAVGHMYRVGIRGDEELPYNSGADGEQELFNNKKTGQTYATNGWGSIEPMSPLGKAPVRPQAPQPAQVLGVSTQAQEQPVQGLSFDQLLEGYGKYGATPSASAVRMMADAQTKYPVFAKNPALLPALSIIETSAGRNMTRPKESPDPQNLMNWGIYNDFVPRDQAHSVERAMSGIGERTPYYQKFRETNNLEDFVNTYAPASDGNEGYLPKLLEAMKYFQN